MTRRQLREHSFKMIYCIDFYPFEELSEQFMLYKESFVSDANDEDKLYLDHKIKEISQKCDQLDQYINEISLGWRTSRMLKVDLCLIRLALYEILYESSIPTKVAINEAVELAKDYGSEESPSFINGILAKLVNKS